MEKPMEAVYSGIDRATGELSDDLCRIARSIYDHPELCFEEYHAAELLTTFLADQGFEVQLGAAGMDTAFVARWTSSASQASDGQKGPRIAFLCEYDALNGLGHACGHHLMGTGCAGAGAVLAQAWPDVPGEILVIGTPAEEGGGGKVLMVDDGLFDDIDAALMFHAGSGDHLAVRGATACIPVEVQFSGKSAHAAGAPHEGINALDAVLQVFYSVNAMRQQLKEDVRIHGIVTDGGDAPNIIPEHAAASFVLRSRDTAYLVNTVLPRFQAIAEAAAQATGAELTLEEGLLYAERNNNTVIASTFTGHLEAMGEKVLPPAPDQGSGSSDIGNVSMVVPTIHPYVAITRESVPGHTRAFAEAGRGELAYQRMLLATKALARTAADLFNEPGLLESAWQELRSSTAQAAR